MVVVKLAVIRRDDTMNAMERVIWVSKTSRSVQDGLLGRNECAGWKNSEKNKKREQ